MKILSVHWAKLLQRQLRDFIQWPDTTSTRYWIAARNICNISGYFFHKVPDFLRYYLWPQEEEDHFPLLNLFLFSDPRSVNLRFDYAGASAARTTLGRRKGGRDLWEHWDESCLLRRRELLLHTTSKFQVTVWQEWISNTISKVCDDRKQFGVWYRWQEEHFGQGT